MFKKAQSYKSKTKKENNNLEINRVVIESFYGLNRKNNSKIIKINNNVYNLKNIDNNMSHGNLNENISNENSYLKNQKNESELKFSNTLCNQTSFKIVSHIKKFDTPLLINNNSFNFCIKKKEKEDNNIEVIKPKIDNENKKIYLIKSFDIFISGNQNLKSKNIRITTSSKKDNIVHREIKDLKNVQNRLEAKENGANNKGNENNLLNSLEIISKRWKDEQKVFKMRLSYTNKSEVLMINLEKYKEELIPKINFEKNNSKNVDNCFISIKRDINSKENNFIYEIIKPNSKKDFDYLFNNLITIDNKENDNILANNSNFSNKEKQKSKFKNSSQINKHNKKNISNNYFCPSLIFNYKELKNIIGNIETDLKIPKVKKDNKFISENNISLNYGKLNGKKNVFLATKVVEHKIIHTYDYLKEKKMIELTINKTKNYEVDIINNTKNKKTKEFGQNTPISLLKEKYFIYAVSKWSKYSIINPEINLYYKYCYKSGRPKFDSNILEKNNFYLGIEKIKIEKDQKKSRNTPNFNNLKKTISTSKITTKTNIDKNSKTKNSNVLGSIFVNTETSNKEKKSKSKQKINQKKNS